VCEGICQASEGHGALQWFVSQTGVQRMHTLASHLQSCLRVQPLLNFHGFRQEAAHAPARRATALAVVPLSPSSSASTILAAGARILGFWVPDDPNEHDSSASLPPQFTGYPPFPTHSTTQLPTAPFPQPPLGVPGNSHLGPAFNVSTSSAIPSSGSGSRASSTARHSPAPVMSVRSALLAALQVLRPSVPAHSSLPGYLAAYALFCLVPSMLTSLTLMLFSYREHGWME
jgi:hypothetical protein